MRQMVLNVAVVGICVAERDAMHRTLRRRRIERPSVQSASTPLFPSVRALRLHDYRSFLKYWGGPLLGVQKANVFTASKMRLLQTFLQKLARL